MKNNDTPAWDPKKHEKRIAEDAERRARELIGRLYTVWKRDFVSSKRTLKEALDCVANLRENIILRAKEEVGAEWMSMTLEIVEDKIESLSQLIAISHAQPEGAPAGTAEPAEPEASAPAPRTTDRCKPFR